jgi:hypothetical protein
MASPRELADRMTARPSGGRSPHVDPRLTRWGPRPDRADAALARFHAEYHHDAPGPHRRYRDYVYDDRSGWWPRWFPYRDQRWCAYWWYLYDHYGGDACPAYAEYARDAVLRQYGPQWGLVVSGAWMGADPQEGLIVRDHRDGGPIVRDHRGPSPARTPPARTPPHATPPEHHAPPEAHQRPHYEHPHYYYRDYVVVDRTWWPRWFPYWDPAWIAYWWQLFHYYGGDVSPDYALYAVDATLRAHAQQRGWL